MQMRKNSLLLLFVGLLTISFISCDEDDDDMDKVLTGSISVDNQAVENDMVTIQDLEISQDGWVVLHRDNGSGAPVVPDIISVPKQVSAGESSDVMVELKDGVQLQDGETLWAMLHTDDGQIGVYEFDGSSGIDAPISNMSGAIVMDSFDVSVMTAEPTGSLTVNDQALVDNTITVESITLDQDGWVVVHADNDGSPMVPDIISDPVFLEGGMTHDNVEITLNEDAGVASGDTVWVMLHTDTGESQVYEFDGESGIDPPITDENGAVVTSIVIQE